MEQQKEQFIKFLEKFDLDICCCGFNGFLTEEEKQILNSSEENPNYRFGIPKTCSCFTNEEILEMLNAFQEREFQSFINLIRKNHGLEYLVDVEGWREWRKKREIEKKRKERIPKKGFIYLIESNSLYKIGRCQNPRDRIKAYKTENPFGIKVIFQKEVDDYIDKEAKLLKKFKDKNYRGEWFKLNEEDIKWTKQNL